MVVTSILAASLTWAAVGLEGDYRFGPDVKAVTQAKVMEDCGNDPSCLGSPVSRQEMARSLRRLGGMGSLGFMCATAASAPSAYPDIREHCRKPLIQTVDPANPSAQTAVGTIHPRRVDMAIGSDGNPVMSYVADDSIKVLHCKDPNCSSSDPPKSVGFGSLPTPQLDATTTSIAIGQDGNPLVIFNIFVFGNAVNTGELFSVHCKSRSCSEQDPPTLLDKGSEEFIAGQWNSVAVVECGPQSEPGCPDGDPVIVWLRNRHQGGISSFTTGLFALVCDKPDCTGEEDGLGNLPQRVTASGGNGPTSIAVDTDGKPLIAFDRGLRRCVKFDCSGEIEDLGCLKPTGTAACRVHGRPSLAIGAGGFPIVTDVGDPGTNDSKGVLWVTACGDSACSAQKLAPYDVLTNAPATGHDGIGDSSVSIGLNGLPIISFGTVHGERIFGRELWFLQCKNPICSSGEPEVVKVDGGGAHNAIAVGIDGLPRIAYTGIHVEADLNSPTLGAEEGRVKGPAGLKVARPPLG